MKYLKTNTAAGLYSKAPFGLALIKNLKHVALVDENPTRKL